MTISVSIELPESYVVRGEGKTAIKVDFSKLLDLDESVRTKLLTESYLSGFLTVMTNTYNSGGKDMQEADRRANLERRIGAFESGTWVSRGGPRDSLEGDMRDAFYNEKGAKDEASRKRVDKDIKALVVEVYGENETARFGTFLRAVACKLAKERKADEAELHGKLVAKYEALAEALRAERSKATSSINIGDLI